MNGEFSVAKASVKGGRVAAYAFLATLSVCALESADMLTPLLGDEAKPILVLAAPIIAGLVEMARNWRKQALASEADSK